MKRFVSIFVKKWYYGDNKSLIPVDYHVHHSLVKTKDIGKPFLNTTNTPANLKSAAATNRWNNNNGSTASNIDGHSKTSSISHGAGSSMLGTSTSASGSSTVALVKAMILLMVILVLLPMPHHHQLLKVPPQFCICH